MFTFAFISFVLCFSVVQPCPTLSDPMDCSTPIFLVLWHFPELAQTHVHCTCVYMYVHPSSCPRSGKMKAEKPVKKLLQYSRGEVMMDYTWGVVVKGERLCKWTYSLRFFSDILLFYQGKKVEFYKARSLVHVGISPCSNSTQCLIPSEPLLG